MGHHREGVVHAQARSEMRPQVDYHIWWAQAGNYLKVGSEAEYVGPETEGWG